MKITMGSGLQWRTYNSALQEVIALEYCKC